MRVLLTSVLLKSGLLTHVWDLAKHLKNSGIDVSVAILEIKEGKRKTDHSLIDPIAKANIPYMFYSNIKELLSFAKKQQAELIHAHSRLVFYHSRITADQLSVPLVLTLHGIYNWRKYYKKSLKAAKQVIAIGSAQALNTNLKHSGKLSIIDNGIDVEHFSPKTFNNWNWTHMFNQQPPLRIVWFGRSNGTASDGVNALNEAIKKLRNKGKVIELKMIGRNQANKTDQFQVIGWVDNPVPFLQDSDIAFGHGRALREAMACGNVGFLLGHGYGGMVKENWFNSKNRKPLSALAIYQLPKTNPNKITNDLELLYDNRKLLNLEKQNARNIAVNYFDIKEMVQKTINVYDKALSNNTNSIKKGTL